MPTSTAATPTFEFKHHHGAISVPDLNASIAWWRDMLGFEIEKRMHISTIPADVAMLRRGELRIELFQVAGAAPLPEQRRVPDTDVYTHGNKHTAFAVQHVESVAEELKQRGADIVWVKRMEHGAAAFVRDNAGNLIEFVEEPCLWSA